MAAPGTYIIRRGATLVFRRRVPSCVAIFYRKSFFTFSLRTHLIGEARRRAAIATRFTDDLIGLIEVCGADMRDQRDIDGVVDDLMRFEVEATEAVRESCGPRSAEAVATAIQVHEATRDTLRAALIYNDYGAVHAPLERTLSRLGLAIDPQTDNYRRLARRCARALVDVAEENIRRENGIYQGDVRTLGLTATKAHGHVFSSTRLIPLPPPPCAVAVTTTNPVTSTLERSHETRPESAPAAPQDVSTASCRSFVERAVPAQNVSTRPTKTRTAPQPVVRRAGIPGDPFQVDVSLLDESSPFSDWFAAAITDKREDNPGWDTNNLGNWRSTLKLMIEAFGDRPVSEYTNRMLLEFRSILQATPKDHHKSSEARGIYTIIEEAEIEEARLTALAENEIEFCGLNRGDAEQALARARVVRMKVATGYRHLQAVQFVFRLAADHKAVPHDLMRKVLWTTKQLKKLQAEENDMSRLAWGDKLPDLLATTAFVSSEGGELHAVFWPTLIAAHAGLRMEEVLQLKAEDFDTIDGIAVIRVQNGEGQHLKSEAADRIVPIHRNLIELGLMRMVNECRARGQEWLFPNVERCAAKGRLSGTFTKVFTHYRITEGVYDPRRDFHSLRTNFNVILKRKKCPLEIRKRLLGHELNDVTEDHYDPEGSPIAEFDEWVQSIAIDISGIKSPYRQERVMVGNVVSFAAGGYA